MQAINSFVEDTRLSKQELRLLVSEADENEDGNIDYTGARRSLYCDTFH